MMVYVALGLAILALVLLAWHALIPTPPAHTRSAVDAGGAAAAAGGA